MSDEVTKTDVTSARKTIALLSDLEPDIKMAKACGIDCNEEEQRCQHLKKFLIAFNELYGANIQPRQS